MAVLAFIAVLIILFLVLIVMVHRRNRKFKSILEEQIYMNRRNVVGVDWDNESTDETVVRLKQNK